MAARVIRVALIRCLSGIGQAIDGFVKGGGENLAKFKPVPASPVRIYLIFGGFLESLFCRRDILAIAVMEASLAFVVRDLREGAPTLLCVRAQSGHK
jgi:hypothetical protein